MATLRKLTPADMAQAVSRNARARAATPAVRIWLGLVTVYLLWGSTYLGIKFALQTIPPLLMGSLRFLVAGGVLFLLATRARESRADRIGWPQLGSTLLIGALLLGGGNGGVILAEQFVPTGVVALLVATAPLWMAVLDRLIFRQHLPRLAVAGLVIGFAGVAFLVGAPGAGRIKMTGAALALAAPICWATGSVLSRHVRLPSRLLVSSALEMTWAGVIFAVASLVSGELGRTQWHSISRTSLIAVLYLVIFGSLVGFSAYVWLLRSAPLSLVSTYAYVNPIVAVILGAIFIGEAITLRTVVAGGIILAAVALIVVARSRAATPAPAPPAVASRP